MEHAISPTAAESYSWRRRLTRLPIFYKVLIANTAIVVIGAIAGTAVTLRWAGTTEHLWQLVALFATIGTIVSVVVNWFVLRAAFQPLMELEHTVDEVRRGNFSVRADRARLQDPHLETLADTFNGMLDTVERYRVQLKNLSMQVVSAQEEERKRIARELHDDTAQVLTAQLLRLKTIEATNQTGDNESIALLIEMTAAALEDVRHMAHELRPPSLDDLGLYASLESLAAQYEERFGIRVNFQAERFRRSLPLGVDIAIYRIVQEALTNVAKHSGAKEANLHLSVTPVQLRATVEDWGCGFNFAHVDRSSGAGLGLFGMRERAALFGGKLIIDSAPGSGTQISVIIPLPSDDNQPASALTEEQP